MECGENKIPFESMNFRAFEHSHKGNRLTVTSLVDLQPSFVQKNYSPLMIEKSYQEIMHDLQINQERLTPYGEVNYFAYPFGQYNEEALQALKDSGFRMAFTTKPGKVQIGDSLLELKRQGIGPWHDLQGFDRKISN